jgi:hypothetical protein
VGEEIEVDFAVKYPGVPSPRVLWQTRQWRLLLLLIDRLPANSFTTDALLNDEEYTEMVIEGLDDEDKKKKPKKADPGPPMSTWSPELEGIAGVNDRLSVLIELQKKKPKKPERYARPKPLLDRKRNERKMKNRWDEHAKLVARVIKPPPAGD